MILAHQIQRPELGVPDANPILHLSHLLRILGPSSLTLYKHVLGRRRILIYTLPPVEAACILCHIAADMCYEVQHDPSSAEDEGGLRHDGEPQRLKGKCREAINVLGMVTLNDTDRMKEEEKSGRGWIACLSPIMEQRD
jgi:DENN domain-containing protein 11